MEYQGRIDGGEASCVVVGSIVPLALVDGLVVVVVPLPGPYSIVLRSGDAKG